MDAHDRAGALTPTGTLSVIRERRHNAFTDIVYWRDRWYLVFRAARSHFADHSARIVIVRSSDLRTWDHVTELKVDVHAERTDPGEANPGGYPDPPANRAEQVDPGEADPDNPDRPGNSPMRGTRQAPEVRDPKFAVVGDTLFLYALLNRSFDPVPYATVWSTSTDGERWRPFRRLPGDWLVGRPQRWGSALCAPAHRFGGTGEVALLLSDDGVIWRNHSTIHRGDFAEESALAVLPDGALIAATRAGPDSIRGSREACTILSRLEPGARLWVETGRDYSTRLDGPALFVHAGVVYAVGRTELAVLHSVCMAASSTRYPETSYAREKSPAGEESVSVLGAQRITGNPYTIFRTLWRAGPPRIGSAFARKRTALFRVTATSLAHLCDLPSAGDTGYAGVALAGNRIAVSYYTTSPGKDCRWIAGMVLPAEVRVTELVDRLLLKHD